MADALFHIGEKPKLRAVLVDQQNMPGANFDTIVFSSTDPGTIITDNDANPLDAEIEFTQLTEPGVDQFVEATVDGDPSAAVREFTLRSKSYQVVPGDAVGGQLFLDIGPVQP